MKWKNEHAYDPIIAQAAAAFGVPASLVKAVIAAESGFRPDAVRMEDFSGPDRKPPSDWPPGVNRDASRGLMQLLCWRARELGYQAPCEGLFEPHTNIMLGTRLLSLNRSLAGTWANAVSAYNGGIRPELGFGSPTLDGKYRNQAYVDRVMRHWAYFETGDDPAGASWGVGRLALLGILAGVVLLPFVVGARAFDPSVTQAVILSGVVTNAGALIAGVISVSRKLGQMEATLESQDRRLDRLEKAQDLDRRREP